MHCKGVEADCMAATEGGVHCSAIQEALVDKADLVTRVSMVDLVEQMVVAEVHSRIYK